MAFFSVGAGVGSEFNCVRRRKRQPLLYSTSTLLLEVDKKLLRTIDDIIERRCAPKTINYEEYSSLICILLLYCSMHT